MSTMDPTSNGAELPSYEHTTSPAEAVGTAQAEPTSAGIVLDAPAQADVAAILPIPPIPLPRRAVSGRYRSASPGFQLELRVDIDGAHPMQRVSGDFFSITGTTRTYFGSFVVDAPAVVASATTVTVQGLGRFTWSAAAPRIKLTIPRVFIFQPPPAATLQFFTLANAPGAVYACPFESIYFRTVTIETDRVSDVTTPVFSTYNTGSLPSGGPARNLSVVGAFAEAGIQMQVSPASDVVSVGEAHADAKWNDAELHASMVSHFSLWQDIAQFKVWELVAQNYASAGVLGIMFDQQGHQRQGCAVFHGGLGGTTADKLRLQLFAYVHELGHCFNLLHSWQKSLATPPGVNRPTALSWMNYPQLYPGGTAAFFAAFPFQFDAPELIHLRHGFLNNVIMGGNNFAVGAGLEDLSSFNPPLQDASGLKLEITAPRSFALGEPVLIDLKLHATDTRGKSAHPFLNPAAGLVQIAICKPGGKVVAYDPMIEQCVVPQPIDLVAGAPIEESVYVGYGSDGLYFDQPGMYQLRAVYHALGGVPVVSNTLQFRVRSPISVADDEVADLLLSDQAGALFYLQGSDSESLRAGRDALDMVIDKHGAHPLAAYARLVKGANLARDFKTVRVDSNTVHVRKANQPEADKLLAGLVDNTAESRQDRTALTAAMLEVADPSRKSANMSSGGAHAAQRRAATKARDAKAPVRTYV